MILDHCQRGNAVLQKTIKGQQSRTNRNDPNNSKIDFGLDYRLEQHS
jgi:hypothetical protein